MTDDTSTRRPRMTMAAWVRQAPRRARRERPATVEAKLAALAEAASHEFPTADVDVMLREIEAGRRAAHFSEPPPGGGGQLVPRTHSASRITKPASRVRET